LDDYQKRLRAALEAQHRKWFDYDRKAIKAEVAEHIGCPVCDATGGDVYFVKDMFRFEKCRNCSMVFLNPRLNVRATYEFYNSEWTSIYNETKFTGGGTTSDTDAAINSSNLALLSASGSRVAGEKLLEIGFGAGHFLRSASSAGYDVYGIDVDTSNYDRLSKEFPGHILNCDVYEANYPSGMFDVTYMRDVFEHVPNPKPLLRELNRATRDGGLVFIEVPNIEGLIYKAVAQRHVVVFGFAHLNYWSPETVRRVLELTGFEVVQMIHESLDFTLAEVARYYLDPIFTTLSPIPANAAVVFSMKALRHLLAIRKVGELDRRLMPHVADWLKRGSVIRVVAKRAGNSR
jgi:2-polyprenyl-3-methyl-5-hydroxy-6-metoxy-1,4-benzoquinol methylase